MPEEKVFQRWTVDGRSVQFEKIPFEIHAYEDAPKAVISIPVGHELAELLHEGGHARVRVVGPVGELLWWEGTIEAVEIGAEHVRVTITSDPLPEDTLLAR